MKNYNLIVNGRRVIARLTLRAACAWRTVLKRKLPHSEVQLELVIR